MCGDGEYIVYTALAWRNKSFGQALEFVWSADSNEYVVRESASKVKIFKDFKVGERGGAGERDRRVVCTEQGKEAMRRGERAVKQQGKGCAGPRATAAVLQLYYLPAQNWQLYYSFSAASSGL